MHDRAGRRRVVVTGMGLVSPHGRDVGRAFGDLLEGKSRIRLHGVGDAPHSVTIPSATCDDFDAAALAGRGRTTTSDRVSQLAVVAALAAWEDAGLADLAEAPREQSCVMLGTSVGGAQTSEKGYRDLFLRNRTRISPLTLVQCMNNAPAAHVAQVLGLGGACLTYSMACASAATAIADGSRRIRSGETDLVLAGGSDAALPYGIVKAWTAMRMLASAADDQEARNSCRPFAADRGGIVLGEGAAILVLEDMEHARRRGARIYAELAGSGSSCDHGPIIAPLATGQVRALRQALHDAGANVDDVGYVNAHGTATPDGDPVEVDALRQCFGDHASTLAVSSTKSMHGHLLGASGAVEACITIMAVLKGAIPPTAHESPLDPACTGVDHVLGMGRESPGLRLALSNSFAFGGSNAVLAFRAV